jgi:hypothetical protein
MKRYGTGWLIVTLLALVSVLGSAAPTQIIESRLSNIERRLDQVQNRVDSVEREQRMSSISGSSRSDVSQATVLELQRQQNSIAQEVILMQQKMLEMTKALDALNDEKRDAAKPKTAEPAKKRT